jgi:hypothetical protein
MTGFKEKVALISAASSGIGETTPRIAMQDYPSREGDPSKAGGDAETWF